MRILHVTDVYRPRVGGIELFVEDLARRQALAGHEVTVLTATPPGPSGADDDLVRVVRTGLSARHPLAPRPALEAALAGAHDVVHAHLSVVSPFATSVARATDEAGIATVHTVHSMWASRRRIVRAVRALAGWDESTGAWTAVSEVAAAEMRDVLRPGTEVHVVANAVDVDWWRDVPRIQATRPVTLVSVMRLAARKRPFSLLDMLDRVVAAVGDTVPVRAIVVGDGPLEQRLRAEVVGRGLASHVLLAGRATREQIRALYAETDVFIAPAHQESFGIAALEARAAGLPVVAMRAGGVGEFIEDRVDGLLCHDDEDMAAAITELVTDPVLRTRIAGHNATCPPAHDWPRTLAEFDDVYRLVRGRLGETRRESATILRG